MCHPELDSGSVGGILFALQESKTTLRATTHIYIHSQLKILNHASLRSAVQDDGVVVVFGKYMKLHRY
ncbi:hypothetical protein [Balneola vulgaris]|uniref:hypothetical protein n=1 Tax=Balneola vulgaris TaxID=287535 RepID=UPI000368D147|nr:hypothetical protein [Balneola vulgaris]